jgi:hypothetical protein
MAINPFIECHQSEICGVLACLDRVVTTGALPAIADDGAMAGLLGYSGIRVFDDTQ